VHIDIAAARTFGLQGICIQVRDRTEVAQMPIIGPDVDVAAALPVRQQLVRLGAPQHQQVDIACRTGRSAVDQSIAGGRNAGVPPELAQDEKQLLQALARDGLWQDDGGFGQIGIAREGVARVGKQRQIR
jgi:hypothetical protein